MKSKYINGMNEIKADNKFKEEIIVSINQNKSKHFQRFFSFNKTVPSIAFTCVFALVIIFFIPYSQNKFYEKTIFNGLTITAYASDGKPIKVSPNVTFSLHNYNTAMNSVPGLPIKIECNSSDSIELTITNGEVVLWTPRDGKILHKGKKLKIKSGETIYWSPIMEGDMDNNSTITINAYKNNTVLGTGKIKINLDKDGFNFTGKLTE